LGGEEEEGQRKEREERTTGGITTLDPKEKMFGSPFKEQISMLPSCRKMAFSNMTVTSSRRGGIWPACLRAVRPIKKPTKKVWLGKERRQNPITCRGVIFWEIGGVERAEQEGKGGSVRGCEYLSKGNFKAVRLRLIGCARRWCFRRICQLQCGK
jgi:hypothetical protein